MNDQHELAPNGAPSTIIDALAAWRDNAPNEVAIRVLHDGENVSAQATFLELHERALAIAALLRRCYEPHTRILLLLPTGLEFVHAFFGCLAAGMIAVPANSPLQSKRKSQWQRLQAIAADSGAELIITTAKVASGVRETQGAGELFTRCKVVDVAEIDTLCDARVEPHGGAPGAPGARDIAFLQYTSGTTATPRGVAITHANVMNNQEVIASLMGHRNGVAGVSWLPLHHDMGLSAILQMASVGLRLTLMPPAAFIQEPLRWLRAISDCRAHSSGGPNFAYELVARELRSKAVGGIDLSSWEVAFCGAEPIRERTVTEFIELASPLGLRPNVFYPCYGLAEVTVAATGIDKGAGAKYLDVSPELLGQGLLQADTTGQGGKKVICCGSPRAGNEVRIVDPDTLEARGEDEVGEIWIRGKSVGKGYWNNPQATAAIFAGYVANDGTGPYLRTGDLGAFHDGELYITGRAKDMIIIRGRNLYPQDIEDVVQDSVAGLTRNGGAAFAIVAGEEEKLVIVQEVGRTLLRNLDSAAVLKAVVAAVVEAFAVTPHAIVLVQPATIEKTSSGKVQRSLCRRHYLQDELQKVACWTDQNEDAGAVAARHGDAAIVPISAGVAVARMYVARQIADVVARHLKVDPERISLTTPWAELGLDSVRAVRLAQHLQEMTGIRLDSTVLWECANIEELAARIATVQEGDAVRSAWLYGGPKAHALRSEADVRRLSEEEATALLLNEIAR